MIKIASEGDWLSAPLLLPVFLDVALKSALVLLLALVVAGCLRRASAATRHLVWFLAVASLLFLPVLSLILPAWHVLPHWLNSQSAPPIREPQVVALKSDATAMPATPEPAPGEQTFSPQPPPERLEWIPASRVETAPAPSPIPLPPQIQPAKSTSSVPTLPASSPPWLLIIWLLGTAIVLLPVALGTFSLWRLARTAHRETDSPWQDLLQDLTARLHLRRSVTLLKSNQRRMPMTWGILRTKLLLPDDSEKWTEARRRVVLLHELAHVKRWDYHTNLFTQIVRALYWFNPLVWLAARQMVAERERACDDIVLRHGAKPADYAEQILEIASGLRLEGFSTFGGIPMARPSKLEGRLRAILDSTRNRAAMTRMMVIGVTAVIASIVIPVAMLRGAPGEQSQTPAKIDVIKVTTNSTSALSTNISPKVRIEPSDPRINENFAQIQKEMTNEWHVGGSVVDDETGTPLANFIVQQGSTNFPNPGATNWQDYTQGGPQYLPSGRWGGTFTYWYRSLRILVPGYIPQIFTKESLADKPASGIEVRMKRGPLILGVVLDADKHPVPGATVSMASARRIYLQDGIFQYGKFSGESTTTDSSGRFALRGEGTAQEKLVVLSADRKFIWPSFASAANENVTVTLPRPGTLAVRYDIPGDLPTAKAELWLITTNNNPALWTDVGIGLSCTVTNGGQVMLTNLTPGTYRYRRWKTVGGQGAETEVGTVEVAAGGTSHLDLVRTNGQRIRGRVLGLDQTKTNGGYIFVRAPEATGQPWPQRSRLYSKEYEFRTYDVLMFQPDGSFETSMLKPGSYSVIAQVHPPEDGNQGLYPVFRNTNPDFVGATEVTIGAAAPPEVTIQLAPAMYVDIAGSVNDETGSPIPNYVIQRGKVDPEKPNAIDWSSGYSVHNGNFLEWNLKSGDALRFLANGYVPQAFTRDEVIASRQTANLAVRLKVGIAVYGVVQEYSGRPSMNAMVIYAPLDFGEMPSTPFFFDWKKTGEGFTSTTASSTGRFSLGGISGKNPRLLAVSADGDLAQPLLVSDFTQDLKITLPEPAGLIVDYDIPYDQAQARFSLELRTNEMEMPLWRDITLGRSIDVTNGGSVVLTNLTPGVFDFFRPRFGGTTNWGYGFLYGDPWKLVTSDRQRIVLEPGKTQHISIVRTGDRRIQGRVIGLDAIDKKANASSTSSVSQSNIVLQRPPDAFLYVSAETTADHPLNFATNPPIFFDAMKLGKDGQFQTAVLAPGNYTLITEVYESDANSRRQYADDEPQYSGMLESAEQKLTYVGSANVTVSANADPQPVTIELHPWKTAPTETPPTNAPDEHGMITGHVVDVETGLPIPDFTVTPGSGWAAADFLPWKPEESQKATNGVFRVPMPQPDNLVIYKIEVRGYMPEMVSERALLTNNTVKLHRGEFITGRVLDPEGHPVIDAQVALHLARTEIALRGTNLYSYLSMVSNVQNSPITATDARGEFKLPAGPGRNGLIAAGAEGFAFVKLDRYETSKDIRLEPWTKVTGTLVSGGQPLKGKTVRVMAGDYASGRLGLWNFDTNLVTDVAGRFSYDRVPPGDTEIAFAGPGVYVSHRVSGTAGAAFNVEMPIPSEPWTNRRPAIADQIAWGPETNGVQSGISLAERPQPRKAGETITVNLWLRNKSSETIYRTNYYASTPSLFAGDEGLVPWKVPWSHLVDEQNPDISRVKVDPGAELRMKTVTVQIPTLPAGTYKLQNLSYYRYGTPNDIQVISGDIPLRIVSGSATGQGDR